MCLSQAESARLSKLRDKSARNPGLSCWHEVRNRFVRRMSCRPDQTYPAEPRLEIHRRETGSRTRSQDVSATLPFAPLDFGIWTWRRQSQETRLKRTTPIRMEGSRKPMLSWHKNGLGNLYGGTGLGGNESGFVGRNILISSDRTKVFRCHVYISIEVFVGIPAQKNRE